MDDELSRWEREGSADRLPQIERWPMVMHEHKPCWSPRRLLRWVYVGSGNRLEERESIGLANNLREIKKPLG
jgi:hypothetical protein